MPSTVHIRTNIVNINTTDCSYIAADVTSITAGCLAFIDIL